MVVRTSQHKDYDALARFYTSFFPTHNRFQQPKKEVIAYLTEQAAQHELLVSEEKGTLTAALFLVNFGQSADGAHRLWKFRHFAFADEKSAAQLLAAAEKRVRAASRTATVELTIAEGESGKKFYEAHGYIEEGALKNHYRWGEMCFVLGKSFGT